MKKVFGLVMVMVVLLTSVVSASAAESVAAGFTRYEGEDGNIVGSNAPNGLGTDTGDQFSNGSAAGYLDVSRCKFEELDATFSNAAHVELKVNADAAGKTELVVGYTCADDADFIAVKANDGAPVKVALKSGEGKSSVSLDLKAGENIIYVSTTILDDTGAQHGWVNIDYVDVKNSASDSAAAADTSADLPKTGEGMQLSIILASAAAFCLLASLVIKNKLKKSEF